ncbi:MAG: polysaccharide biosynthesis/export family protein [Chitinophagaceae bacterium]|nr:polysaccharide biosynthesis/export family protein [Chitinophagaceae bacterium]
MKFTRILLLFTLPLYFFSCRTQQKMPYYLEQVNDSTGKGDVKIPELRIQKNDLISIQINSIATDPKIDGIYNLQIVGGSAQSGGYLVDGKGNIEHFRLGTFHAEGMTKTELAGEIKRRLTQPVELLRDPTVIIRFLNFKITMLGEIGQQGVITVPGESITILEAVGLAGGVSEYGKKTNLKIMREIDGKRETGYIDLSSKDLFESPYYHLMQNDVVVVEQTKQKVKESEQAKTIQKISFAFTLVTVAATMANIFIKN